jgi:FMN phosphatase YigB (HAD superfamily)
MLLIFDVDGVLSKEDKIFKARYTKQIEYIAKKLKISKLDAKRKYEQTKRTLPARQNTTSAYLFTNFGFSREEFFKVMDSVHPKGLITPFDGCEETIRLLSQNNVVVTFSNSPRKASIRTLKILKIAKYISRIYSSEDFTESKPSVNILKKILKDMHRRPKEAILVGNSIEKDIAPARKLGMRTILFDTCEKNGNADHVIRRLKDIFLHIGT